MKAMLILVLVNTMTGSKTTLEIPAKDFGECLKMKKEVSEQVVPEGYKVKKFECEVGDGLESI